MFLMVFLKVNIFYIKYITIISEEPLIYVYYYCIYFSSTNKYKSRLIHYLMSEKKALITDVMRLPVMSALSREKIQTDRARVFIGWTFFSFSFFFLFPVLLFLFSLFLLLLSSSRTKLLLIYCRVSHFMKNISKDKKKYLYLGLAI